MRYSDGNGERLRLLVRIELHEGDPNPAITATEIDISADNVQGLRLIAESQGWKNAVSQAAGRLIHQQQERSRVYDD